MSKGIDVSKYQGKINWSKVKSSGIEFAMLRAGYGRYDNQKDEYFEENYANAKQSEIKLGAYIYSYAKTVNEAKSEAQTFLKWISGKQFEYPVAFDIEEKSQLDLGKQAVSDIIRAFCSTVESAGYYVCVYSNKYWFDNFIDDDCKKKYDTWLAQWADKPTYAGSYGIWQYSSKGSVDGITGNTDLDEAYKNYPEIIKAKGLNGFSNTSPSTPAVPTNPTPTPQKPSTPATKNFTARMMVSLDKTPLYVSATAKTPSAKKSGTFYIYDGIEINGRYRITTSPSRAGKTPISQNVTGYVNKSDIR